MILYPIIALILFLFDALSAVFLPTPRSLNVSNFYEAVIPHKYPSRSSSTSKRSPIFYEVLIKHSNDAFDREEPIEEESESSRSNGDGRPPEISRMPSFYRYGSYGSNRPRGCMGPNCPFIRPPTPYNYGSNYMGPTPSPERYERPYEPMPYRPSMPMHFRRPRRPYDGFVPPYMGPSPGPGSSYPGPFERPNILGPPQWGYGRLNMPYGGPGKSPMDWQDGTDMSNGLTEPDSGPDSEVGVYMSSYGYSYAGYIERQAKMYPIMMYTLVQCIPCQRAKHLLAINYADIRSHFLELVGNEDWQRQLQVDLQHITGAVTFPYIFICGTYIGGSSDLFQLHQTGQLRRMVSACNQR